MVKKVVGGYINVEEAAAEVEHLFTEGYTSSDVVVVTKSANKGAIESLTSVNVDPVADKKGVAKGDPNLINYGDANDPLGMYRLDADAKEHFTKTIKNDGYVVLVEQDAKPNKEGNDLERSPIKSKDDPTIARVGQVSEAYRGKPEDTDESPTVEGIPAATSNKEQEVNEKNIPFSPGTPRDPSES